MGLFTVESLTTDSEQATTVKFDNNMITSKNLTSHGVIKYNVASPAKKYNGTVKTATNKWNKALGKRVFAASKSSNDSRLVITNSNITPGLAGVAEVNSGVIGQLCNITQAISNRQF